MLFLFVLAGGKLMWNQTSSVNVMSVGVIAAIGGLYCEKFEDIITTLLALKKPDTESKV